MKNKIYIIFVSLFLNSSIMAENILIEAKKITIDKDRVTSIFEDEVIIKTKEKEFS